MGQGCKFVSQQFLMGNNCKELEEIAVMISAKQESKDSSGIIPDPQSRMVSTKMEKKKV